MTTDHRAFEASWRRDGPRVLAYARRHVGADLAQDVVAETFAVAWRRWDAVPCTPLPWLIGTASRVMHAQRRTTRRQHAIADRLSLLLAAASDPDPTLDRAEALRRLAALPHQQQEVLLLTAWDGLSATEAAGVLGVTPAGFRKRLQRARAALDDPPAPATTHPPTILITETL